MPVSNNPNEEIQGGSEKRKLEKALSLVFESDHPCLLNYNRLVNNGDTFSEKEINEMATLNDIEHVDAILLWSKWIMRCTTLTELDAVLETCFNRLKNMPGMITVHDKHRAESILIGLSDRRKDELKAQTQIGSANDNREEVKNCLDAEQ